MDDSKRRVLGLVELARRYRVPISWLRAEAKAGRLPSVKAGSQHLFNVEAVDRALAERAASTNEGDHQQERGGSDGTHAP